MFSLLWSEHCGYKHSALLLRRLPSEGSRVLQGPGENAGVLDLGDGLAVAFKVTPLALLVPALLVYRAASEEGQGPGLVADEYEALRA